MPADLILLSGSRATGHLTPLSDWDYIVFGKHIDFNKNYFDLKDRHLISEHVDVSWGSKRTKIELYRFLCFCQVFKESKHGFFQYLIKQIYPDGLFPSYTEAQLETAKSRINNILRFSDELEAVQTIMINLAHQHSKFLGLPLPSSKKDLVKDIKDWSVPNLIQIGERWIQEIEGELSSPKWAEVDIVNQEIAEYVFKYGISKPERLEEKIKSGSVEGHPAWEELIEWTNLLEYRQNLWNGMEWYDEVFQLRQCLKD